MCTKNGVCCPPSPRPFKKAMTVASESVKLHQKGKNDDMITTCFKILRVRQFNFDRDFRYKIFSFYLFEIKLTYLKTK